MKRSDEYGRRRWPDERYGGYEQGYGSVPGDDRNWRSRDLSGGRYGNTRERNPYDTGRDDDIGRRSRFDAGRSRARAGAVYYPARSGYEEMRDESTPHNPGYVSAYSSGYEDGYQAGARGSRETPSRTDDDRWERSRQSRYADSGRDYDPAQSRNYRQRSRGDQSFGQERSEYGYARRVGPKNYTRSDERIREEVCERLAHESGLDVSDVNVVVNDAIVTLTGTVDNRRTKYEVEDVADDTYGVSDVINQLHVRPYGVLASE